MAEVQLDPTKVEVLKTLYPIFKKEVYERREQLTRISRFGISFYVGIIVLCFVFPVNVGSPSLRLYSALAIFIFAGVLIYQMKQHQQRHIMAKHAVIEIEKALHLFEPGFYLSGTPLYPEEWSRYKGGKGEMVVTSFLLIFLAGITVLALWSV